MTRHNSPHWPLQQAPSQHTPSLILQPHRLTLTLQFPSRPYRLIPTHPETHLEAA
ncbi:hypothetical protein BDW60DRAFT_193319 [Aspergillus nidulans var. acristatus]